MVSNVFQVKKPTEAVFRRHLSVESGTSEVYTTAFV